MIADAVAEGLFGLSLYMCGIETIMCIRLDRFCREKFQTPIRPKSQKPYIRHDASNQKLKKPLDLNNLYGVILCQTSKNKTKMSPWVFFLV
jgi:hypothetical protein